MVVCANCQTRPATKEYILSGEPCLVCDSCSNKWDVQHAYESRLLEIINLKRQKKCDEALACLDSIWDANKHRDHDHWLSGSIARDRAEILFETGRYAEAEQAYRGWAEVGFANVWHRLFFAGGLAQLLEATGRDQEAIQVLEDVLAYDDPRHEDFALRLLVELIRLSEKVGQPVNPKWLTFPETVAKRNDLEMPVRDTLSEAIEALLEARDALYRGDPNAADDDDDSEAEGDAETDSTSGSP